MSEQTYHLLSILSTLYANLLRFQYWMAPLSEGQSGISPKIASPFCDITPSDRTAFLGESASLSRSPSVVASWQVS